MKRLSKTLTIAAVIVLGVTGLSRAEVWIELDGSGHVIASHIPSSRNTAGVWRATGEAPSQALVLNVEGAARGDGRPDIAIDPVSGNPRAVWSMRTGGGFDIVTSVFNGLRWSDPIPVTSTFGVDDLDPRIAFKANGTALVTWWTDTAVSAIQLAFLPAGGTWHYPGVISNANEKAKLPAIHVEGNILIVAYRTPSTLKIGTFAIAGPVFGDGPTPFPRDNGGNNGPTAGDEPPPDGTP